MKRFTTFLGIGGATAGVYFGVLSVLMDGLHVDYRVSVSVAYCCGVLFHFFMNRHVTFTSGDRSALIQALRYIVVAALNYMITLGIVSYAVQGLHVSPYTGVFFALCVTTLVGYYMFKVWVFSSRNW